jgi:cell pole-organizing protein PopZ
VAADEMTGPSMNETKTAIRRAIIDEEAGEMTLSTEPQTFDARPETKRASDGSAATELRRGSEAGLLSRESTAAVDTAFNMLAQTVKKHEPTLEEVVRETLRPMLMSWLDENLPRLVERMVRAEIERVTRGR